MVERVARAIARAETKRQGHTMQSYIDASETRWPSMTEAAKAAIKAVFSYKEPDKVEIDEDALLAAAEVWHYVKMGKMALPWFETSLDWRTDCIKTARSLIDAYMVALDSNKPIDNKE